MTVSIGVTGVTGVTTITGGGGSSGGVTGGSGGGGTGVSSPIAWTRPLVCAGGAGGAGKGASGGARSNEVSCRKAVRSGPSEGGLRPMKGE